MANSIKQIHKELEEFIESEFDLQIDELISNKIQELAYLIRQNKLEELKIINHDDDEAKENDFWNKAYPNRNNENLFDNIEDIIDEE